MIGAPVLAGTSALRTGAGLVQVAVPQSILPAAISITPELIGLALGKMIGADSLLEDAQKADAIVMGPGLGQSRLAAARVSRLIQLDKPMVVDADGLNLLAAGKRWPGRFRAHAVLTPHPGEMARLVKLIGRDKVPSDEAGRTEIAAKAAVSFGQVVVLKGHRTIVTDGQSVYVNDTGDSSLSKAGTGDVLSGIVGTLLAQKMNRLSAAIAAVWIHGRAGELAGQRIGRRSVLSREVIEEIPAAIAEYERREKR